MKKLLLSSLFSLLICAIFAQVPQRMNYQSVIRDANDALVVNAPVGVQISIVNGTTQNAVYVEEHSASTNAQGLLTLEIGSGSVVSGAFEAIDWSEGHFLIEVETDPDGGTDYSVAGSSELLSVPYAFYAQSGPGSGSATLNDAYNSGGAGEGRVIIADAGSVLVIQDTPGEPGLRVESTGGNVAGISTEQSGSGWAIVAESTNATNNFPALSAASNSSDSENAAIKARNVGAGFAVMGEIPASASGTAAVYGSNLRPAAGAGVSGIGFHGTLGRSQSPQGYGIYGINNNPGSTDNPSIAVYGRGFHGIYGETTNESNGWAGFFTADIGVEGAGFAENGWQTLSDGRLKSDLEPIGNALENLLSLQGLRYTLHSPVEKDGIEGIKQYGVLAQDVASVFPEMIAEKAFYLNQGDETVYQTVNYTQLVPVLIEALREMKSELDTVKEELQELRTK